MEKPVYAFSYFNCCDDAKAMFAEAALQDFIPVDQFINHAKECKDCGEVLHQHINPFIASLPAPIRMMIRHFEKQITT